ncbi:hypothetical protein GBAR_LOCUS28091 [Geodia barretti]|uniref:Secreted protein n=1 Tax=Geodia barretti TaxID=519541 RepID=A0AA35TP85_GEOBA|nr:hypothetical protein GBAR_LOCUS28091 [Geodia barretti]
MGETTLQLATLLLALSSGHTTTYTATTLTACTLLLETTADYITVLGRLAKQQNLLYFLLESSAAAKKDKMKLSRK